MPLDPPQARYYDTFLKYILATSSLEDPPAPATVQPVWWIDPENPNASNNWKGDDPAKPLKTWAAYQSKLGLLSVLAPTGGFGVVHVQSSLLPDDPIGWYNFVNGVISVEFKKTTAATGVLTTVQVQDFTTSAINAITDAGKPLGFWDPFIGETVELTTGASAGAYAQICGTGPGVAILGDWIADVTIDALPLTFPAAPPSPGDSYRIISTPSATLGVVGLGSVGTFSSVNLGIPGGAIFKNAKFRQDSRLYPSSPGKNISGVETLFAYRSCQFECGIETDPSTLPGQGMDFASCSFRRGFFNKGGTVELQCVHAPIPGEDATSRIESGPSGYVGGRNVYYGDFASSTPAEFKPSSFCHTGAIGAWNSDHGIYVGQDTTLLVEPGFIFGDLTETIWGGGNAIPMFGEDKSTIHYAGFNGGLPLTITNASGLTFWTAFVDVAGLLQNGEESSAFDPTTGLFTAYRPNTLANMSTLIGGGGFATRSVGGTVTAVANNVQTGARVVYELFA